MKLDHLKLAKRHLGHLSSAELENIRISLTIMIHDKRLLEYVDAKMLQRFTNCKSLPRVKGKFVKFNGRFKL
jgi:hypothetical protein